MSDATSGICSSGTCSSVTANRQQKSCRKFPALLLAARVFVGGFGDAGDPPLIFLKMPLL